VQKVKKNSSTLEIKRHPVDGALMGVGLIVANFQFLNFKANTGSLVRWNFQNEKNVNFKNEGGRRGG